MLTYVKISPRLPSRLEAVSSTLGMTTTDQSESKTPKWLILLCLVIFIGSAALGGYALAKGAEEKASRKSADPFADRSLFGR